MSTLRFVVFALVSGMVGCEPRIEEPVPPRRDTRQDVASTSSGQSASAPQRCVFPTPDKPKRPTPPPGPDPRCPADPETPPQLRPAKVIFPSAKDKPTEVAVEIAQRERDQARGLMFRTSMAEERGMIFVFEEPEEHHFWMRNTCIALDMLFIDTDGLIVGIEENVPTMNDRTYAVPCPSRYVLEVNAGYCRRHGIVAGQKVQLEGL